ncbi:hypothetical protein EDD58_1114 [Hazenella coriacea]|uniref:Uncharacterized protein n=1 Tax=Hazenella coriacea TaxID=1179467 RepID=A0A4R3L0I6_9BACL|nr:hypothetical protein EDD58_1114 [Hazenella coriacea]
MKYYSGGYYIVSLTSSSDYKNEKLMPEPILSAVIVSVIQKLTTERIILF